MKLTQKFKLTAIACAAFAMVACSSTDPKDAATAPVVAPVTTEPTVTAPVTEEKVDTSAQAAVEAATVYYFAFDNAELSAENKAALDIVAAAMKGTSNAVRLEGHTDERGTREYNMALGERRAKSVQSYLSAQGVDAKRLEVISYGEEKPAAVGTDDGAMGKNRRVELVK